MALRSDSHGEASEKDGRQHISVCNQESSYYVNYYLPEKHSKQMPGEMPQHSKCFHNHPAKRKRTHKLLKKLICNSGLSRLAAFISD